MTYLRQYPHELVSHPGAASAEYRELAQRQPNTWHEEPGASPFEVLRGGAFRAALRPRDAESVQTRMERRLGVGDPDPDVLAPEQLSGVDYERDRERITHLPLIVQRLPSSAGPPPSVDAMWLTGLEMSQYEDGAAADARPQT